MSIIHVLFHVNVTLFYSSMAELNSFMDFGLCPSTIGEQPPEAAPFRHGNGVLLGCSKLLKAEPCPASEK